MNPIQRFLAWITGINQPQHPINMKLSEVKTAIAKAAAANKEALGEVSTRIADLNKKIDDLVAGNADPDITDEEFTESLEALKTDAQALADIVPNADPETPPTPEA